MANINLDIHMAFIYQFFFNFVLILIISNIIVTKILFVVNLIIFVLIIV